MSIRKPIKVLTFSDAGDVGASSAAGVVTKTFQLPQDTDNVVMKLQASLVGASVSATLQTTDDGGSTWYDVVRTPNATLVNNTIAMWASAPVIGMGIRSTNEPNVSVLGGGAGGSILTVTGSSAASSLGVAQVSGLPIMDTLARVALIYTGAITTNDKTQVDIYANNQSNRA